MTHWAVLSRIAPGFVLSAAGRPVPLVLGLEVTRRCNASCSYCSVCEAPDDDMPLEVLLSLLTEAYAAGSRIVSFSGGEPLLRKDIEEIINHAFCLGFLIRLNTNGTLPISDSIMEKVPLYDVSLDGPAEVQQLTRPGADFERVKATLERLRRHPRVSSTITTVLTRPALEHLDSLLKLAERFDARVNFNRPRPSMGADKVEGWLLDSQEYAVALRRILEHPLRRRVLNSTETLRHLFASNPSPLATCPMGRVSLRVDHDGSFNDCFERPPLLDVRYPDVTFAEGFARIVGRHLTNCPRCTVAECVNTSLLVGLSPETALRTLLSLL